MVQGGMMLCTVVCKVLVSWCPVVAKVVLGVAAAEPPEAYVHGFEHHVHHGFVGDANGGGVVTLNGRGGVSPAHFHESISMGYHGFGADEEAREFGFSGGRHDVFNYLGNGEDGPVERGIGVFSESMM